MEREKERPAFLSPFLSVYFSLSFHFNLIPSLSHLTSRVEVGIYFNHCQYLLVPSCLEIIILSLSSLSFRKK